jgi:hypothetical protein
MSGGIPGQKGRKPTSAHLSLQMHLVVCFLFLLPFSFALVCLASLLMRVVFEVYRATGWVSMVYRSVACGAPF